MLKPIQRVTCSPALTACQRLMQRFALWLCAPTTTAAHISQQGMQPPVLASVIEANWLWSFLQRVEAGQSLLSRAQTVAAMPTAQKAALSSWIQTVSALALQFQHAQTPWPINQPVTSKSDWKAFKELFESFYKIGFKSGLPYLPNGIPTVAGGVNYADYVTSFRTIHRLNPNPDAREVCVLCGGSLGDTPQVDHWVLESKYPLLSVCPDNLCLICSTCNEAPNKGQKPVHSNGSFTDWFHPYLRPGNGTVRLKYLLPDFIVKCSPATHADYSKTANLDALLDLGNRWTREFKAEYAKHQDILKRKEQRRVRSAQARYTEAEMRSYIQEWQLDLVASEPHYEVHHTLSTAIQEKERIDAWLADLALVT